MSLSDATIHAANDAIRQVFETTSLAWRTIPHWVTGDPAQTFIRNDSWFAFPPPGPPPPPPPVALPIGGAALPVTDRAVPFLVTHAQATASTPDQVVAAATATAVNVVAAFDSDISAALVTPGLAPNVGPPHSEPVNPGAGGPFEDAGGLALPPTAELIGAATTLQFAGYQQPRCVWAGFDYFDAFHRANGADLALPASAQVLNMSSLYWSTAYNAFVDNGVARVIVAIIGRRQYIQPGRAFEAAPGPEPIDLAVSVPPSLEIVGEDGFGRIQLAVRVKYALRFKDHRAVVVWHNP
jgi:hypothetical protein